MKKASTSFLVFFFSALFFSLQSFAQSTETISENIQHTLQVSQRMALKDLLRLSPQEQRQMEVLSLTLMAQSVRGPSQLEVLAQSRSVHSATVRRQLKEVKVTFTSATPMADLEVSASEEVFIESVSAEVIRRRQPQPVPVPQPQPIPPHPHPAPQPQPIPTHPHPIPGPLPHPAPYEQQPLPNSMITLRVNQDIRGYGEIPLKAMLKQQHGLSLEGVEIERVALEAQPLMYGRTASVYVEINNRAVSPAKYISANQRRLPLPVNSTEEIRSMRLVVNGDARINEIHIRFGQVRPSYNRPEQIIVRREVSAHMPLDLSHLLPYEQRQIRAISLEARALRTSQAEIALISSFGELLGSVVVSQIPMKPMIQLMRPMQAREIKLHSISPVLVESLEIEFTAPYYPQTPSYPYPRY